VLVSFFLFFFSFENSASGEISGGGMRWCIGQLVACGKRGSWNVAVAATWQAWQAEQWHGIKGEEFQLDQ